LYAGHWDFPIFPGPRNPALAILIGGGVPVWAMRRVSMDRPGHDRPAAGANKACQIGISDSGARWGPPGGPLGTLIGMRALKCLSTEDSLGDGERRVQHCEIRPRQVERRFSFLGSNAAGDQFAATLLIV